MGIPLPGASSPSLRAPDPAREMRLPSPRSCRRVVTFGEPLLRLSTAQQGLALAALKHTLHGDVVAITKRYLRTFLDSGMDVAR